MTITFAPLEYWVAVRRTGVDGEVMDPATLSATKEGAARVAVRRDLELLLGEMFPIVRYARVRVTEVGGE